MPRLYRGFTPAHTEHSLGQKEMVVEEEESGDGKKEEAVKESEKGFPAFQSM